METEQMVGLVLALSVILWGIGVKVGTYLYMDDEEENKNDKGDDEEWVIKQLEVLKMRNIY